MLMDITSSQTSLTQADALESWNGLILGFLAHSTSTPEHLGRVLQREPDFAMALAAKGLFSMMMGRRELIEVAHQANTEAQRALALGGATERERLWCDALNEWVLGRPSYAVLRLEQALALNPADTLSMKTSHALRFILGDARGMRRSVEAVMAAHDRSHPLRGYALGCLAFAQEETGSYAMAEKSGREALEYAPDDAWGLHAVAHVYDMTHRPEQGIVLIDQNSAAWTHCNNFRFHVWWHKALLHLDQGDHAHVLELYDAKIRHEKTDDYRDFSNASSLLMRLELEGADVGSRWGELADLAESRSHDGCLVFADLHYMLALSGDHRPDAASRLLARVARDATGPEEGARIMLDPGRAAAEGLAAFGEAQYDTAYRNLAAARPQFQSMGGSHAQRDIFERMTIEAALRAGHLGDAEMLLNERTKLRNGAIDSFAEARMQMLTQARAFGATMAAQ